ncbi:hypothetical protein EVA_18736 [gut metagenome]|uniref:Uncharacterized protein n=1 Tax=gut metagenome TaxID=749906 RepID=J9C030_9ZZZZ
MELNQIVCVVFFYEIVWRLSFHVARLYELFFFCVE